MKIRCQQQLLSKALNVVSKGVTSRTTIPILKGIFLEVESFNTLKMTASDLDLTIEIKVEINADELGSIVVSSKLFTDIIRKMPDGEVEIEIGEDNHINIKCQKSEFDIMGLPADEFPNINEMEESNAIKIDKDIFKDMIRKTSFSVSLEEARGILTGVLLELKQNQISMVALDGFRMATCKNTIEYSEDIEKNIVISGKIINEINKILNEEDDGKQISISMESKRIVITTQNIKIIARLMEGDYIQYENIFPQEKKSTIKLNKNDIYNSIERASLLAKEGKNNLIKMSVQNNKIIITSRSEEGKVREEVFIEQEGKDIEIGFNSKYIMDVLKALSEEEIVMEFNTNVNPCVIVPTDGDHFKYLILPVRITS